MGMKEINEAVYNIGALVQGFLKALLPAVDDRISVRTKTVVHCKTDDYSFALQETEYTYTVKFSETKEECDKKAARCRDLAFRDMKAKMERLNKQGREFFVVE